MKANDLNVRTIYVARNQEEDVRAHQVAKDLKEFVRITGLKEVRRIMRYDVTGAEGQLNEPALDRVFLTPPFDTVSADGEADGAAYSLLIEPVPGQYDQRADSSEQLLRLLLPESQLRVHCVEIFHFFGELSTADCEAVKKWLINPVESREASAAAKVMQDQPAATEPIPSVEGFCAADREQLRAIHQQLELTMSPADLSHTQAYYQTLKREPTLTEIKVLDTYWSDHCRHTTFNTRIESVRFETEQDNPVRGTHEQFLRDKAAVQGGRRQEKPLCLMELATQGTRYLQDLGAVEDLDLSEEINACSIKRKVVIDGTERDYLIMFKNETHNHPTEIEPFGGAATCLGGGIRDPLSGRSNVYQAMRLSGCGDPTAAIEQTLPNKLPQRQITRTAARGYSSYGDQIGLSAGFLKEIYHPGFTAKRMELGALVAAAPAENVVRERPSAGDIVVLVGGRTGRDGVGGATGSSRVQTVDAFEENSAEVQKGNALIEHNIQRLFRDPKISPLIKRCNDFGAGGVSVAIGELADGLKIELDRVPLKYPGLNGTEIAIAESQERMAVVLDPADVDTFLCAAEAENLEVTVVAEVTAEPKLVMNWRGQTIVDLDRAFLDTNGAVQTTEVLVEDAVLPQDQPLVSDNFADNLENRLNQLNECSQSGMNEWFDNFVGGETILAPLGGAWQQSPEMGMASLVPAEGTSETATLMTYGYYPELAEHSPYHAAYRAVLTSILKAAAMGSDPATVRLSFQEYFRRLESSADWGLPYAALLGAYRAQCDYRVPSIGGKDSMSGSYEHINVPPTLISFAVTTVPAERILSATFARSGLQVYACAETTEADGLPQVGRMLDQLAYLKKLAENGRAEHALVAESSWAAALSKACFGNALGFEFAENLSQTELFAQRSGQLILATAEPLSTADCTELGLVYVGSTLKESRFVHNGSVLSYERALQAYESRLAEVFPRSELGRTPLITFEGQDGQLPACSCSSADQSRTAGHAPRVLLPVFYGTTGEYELERALREAGADVVSHVFRIGRSDWAEESFNRFAADLRTADALVLAGGCTLGDQPEGVAKLIESILRDPRIRTEIESLLARAGRMLGLGNGFQALVGTGLLPHGRFLDEDEKAIAFRKNRGNDHLACLTDVRVLSDKGGWFAADQVGRQFVSPLSSLYRELNLSGEELASLRRNQQIAAVYDAAPDCPEALISPDGLVFGRMTHPERLGKGRAVNLPGQRDFGFFERFVNFLCCGQ